MLKREERDRERAEREREEEERKIGRERKRGREWLSGWEGKKERESVCEIEKREKE